MNHKEKLKEIYSSSFSINDINDIPAQERTFINVIARKVYNQKGAYTVLITLLVHKIIAPSQDIRYHQSSMKNGFSGRTIDTQFITPTLKELGLPSMAESGWLTRSLEQPYPYTLTYNGHISDKSVKKAFLGLIDYAESNPKKTINLLRILLNAVIEIQSKNQVRIIKLKNPDDITIKKTIDCLFSHFSYKYNVFGGAKLPVLAFYAIYEILVEELGRYSGCQLAPLGSHTACDRTSKTAGDIQVFKGDELIEAVEIKFDRIVDLTIVKIAVEKILKYNPKRYYIFSSKDILDADQDKIRKIIDEIKTEHGCQIIINGLIPSLKYYLRLISSLKKFVSKYSHLVESDLELKKIHKERWNLLLKDELNK